MYGSELPLSTYRQTPTVIGEVIHTHAGNISLRIGEMYAWPLTAWHQTGFVTLTPGERDALVAELMASTSDTYNEGDK